MRADVIVGCALAAFAIGGIWWGVSTASRHADEVRASYDRKRADFFQAMKRDKCLRTGFAGKYAEPIWTCPDGMAYKEP